MIIDCFCHYISDAVGKLVSKTKYYGEGREFPYPTQNADPEVRLSIMAKYAVDVQAISQTAPVLLGLNDDDAVEACRLSNQDNYTLCKAYPDKFVNVCIFHLPDMKSTLDELKRSVNELDCRAVTIATNQSGRGLDDEAFFPFYEKAAELDLPILLHGTHWEASPLMDMENAWRFMHVFGWDYDGTQALWRLIFGGVLDRFPTLKIVTHHLGNYFPFFVRRIEKNFEWQLQDKLPRHISEYYGNIYGDTAVDGTPGAFGCGYAFFGAERMMYGSDYPFGPESGEDFIRENLAGVRALAIPEPEKNKILGENAIKLFKM